MSHDMITVLCRMCTNHLIHGVHCHQVLCHTSLITCHPLLCRQSPGAASRLRDSAVLELPPCGDGDGPPAHPSLSLASDRLALLSTGRGVLHVAETGDRSHHQPWQVLTDVQTSPGGRSVTPPPLPYRHTGPTHVVWRTLSR